MKCASCIDELYKRIKKETKDRDVREAKMMAELPNLPDAVAIYERGWQVCMKHYIQLNSW